MDLGLRGKRALVTAASDGLGRAVARGLAAEGARVAICSRQREKIDAVGREIAATKAEVHALVADVSRAEDCARVVADAAAALGGLDILFANAGGPRTGQFVDLADDDWRAAFDLTLMSVVRLVRAAIPHLEKSGSGRILVLTSTSVKEPIPGLLLSNAMRAAVTNLVRTLADELAPKGIRVNTVAPGRIATERLKQLDEGKAKRIGSTPDAVRAAEERAIALGRYGKPEEFADAVVWLASERASYVTGTTILVDGGKLKR
jgi:3-oxoacyl-[acyl-carrier protein] reductase